MKTVFGFFFTLFIFSPCAFGYSHGYLDNAGYECARYFISLGVGGNIVESEIPFSLLDVNETDGWSEIPTEEQLSSSQPGSLYCDSIAFSGGAEISRLIRFDLAYDSLRLRSGYRSGIKAYGNILSSGLGVVFRSSIVNLVLGGGLNASRYELYSSQGKREMVSGYSYYYDLKAEHFLSVGVSLGVRTLNQGDSRLYGSDDNVAPNIYRRRAGSIYLNFWQ